MAWTSTTRSTAKAPPVLFCHEFAGDYRSWAPQVLALARRYRTIVYSARGYLHRPSDR